MELSALSNTATSCSRGTRGTKKEAAAVFSATASFSAWRSSLVRLSILNSFIVQVVLGGTVIGTAYHRLHTDILHLRDQTQRTTMRTSQHGNVRVARLAHRSRVLQHKQGSRFHLLWNPLSKQFKIRQHAHSSCAILLPVITLPM